MDFVHNQEHINEDVEDDDMPPLVDKPEPSSTYTFLLDSASPSLANTDSSQVTPSTITIASSSNAPITDPATALSRSSPPSPMTPDGPATISTQTTRPRSKSTRGSQSKKREASHIPRPPNAFILFRSSFIRSQQIPDKVEGNHSHCWKALSPEERAEWEAKAVVAQEVHRQEFPDWRFRPGPYAMGKLKTKDGGPATRRRNTISKMGESADGADANDDGSKDEPKKSRSKGKEKETNRSADDTLRDSRCEKIASLMMVEGKTGSELTIAMEEWEDMNKRIASGSQMKFPLRDDRGQLTPRSPGYSSPASTPDRHSVASNPATERSPDLSQSSLASQSPATSTVLDTEKSSDSAQHVAVAKGSRKAPPKGISTVPLTQMFARSHSGTYFPTSSPSIADLCPPTQFEVSSTSTNRRVHPEYPKPQIHTPSVEYNFPSQRGWQTEESAPPYGSQSGQESYWQWQSQSPSDLREGSSDKRRSEDLPQREMGYETDNTVMAYDTYGKSFTSDDLPPDGSEIGSWSTNPNRHGLMAVITDPLDEPPSLLSGSFGMARNTDPQTPHSTGSLALQPTFYYPPIPGGPPPSLNLPATSFSTLTGWAGEYPYIQNHRSQFDKSDNGSPSPSHPDDWYPQQSQWPTSNRQHDHQMGMALSSDDWDRVEEIHQRTSGSDQ